MLDTTTLMSPDKANDLAEVLNSDKDDDWTYKAQHDPKGTGMSFVTIHDETGTRIGTC